ncbi:MAG: tctC [Ramlibacter sp.]|nr:tctC [Ramlibacter sp.]
MLRTCLNRLFRGLPAVAFAGLVALASTAHAAWPERPITLVVGYAAGGSVDAIARLVAQPLSERLGQPIVIENVGGAGGSIGAARVARAAPDGYTLMLGSGSEVAIAWAVNPSLKYNGITGLTPISLISTSPMVLVANPGVAVSTLDELLAYSKAHPGKLSLATSGVGTPQHLMLEYMNRRAGIDILHVPYRSASSIAADVIGGRVDLSILTLSTAMPFIESGKMKSLAVTGASASPLLPKAPTLGSNARLRGADFELWFGLLAPGGLPAPVVERLHRELQVVLQRPDVQENLRKQGMLAAATTSAQFAAYVKADSAKYQRIIKEADISVK